MEKKKNVDIQEIIQIESNSINGTEKVKALMVHRKNSRHSTELVKSPTLKKILKKKNKIENIKLCENFNILTDL